MTQLIVTADDFGLAVPVNEAVEQAHRDGILTSASLMVGADAVGDAVARARRLPDLCVGLHLVLVEGRPVLPPDEVPRLVDPAGRFSEDLVRAGVRYFFSPQARAELAREIRAQFEAFAATGLPLDHVDAHNHLHLHPTVLTLLVEIGRDFGLRAVRVPCEPYGPSWRAMRTKRGLRLLNGFVLRPWVELLRARVERAGLCVNQTVLGLNDTGSMDEATVLRLLGELPDGVVEMYMHPATRRCPEIDRSMPDYAHEAELAALVSDAVRRRIEERGVQLVAFRDVSCA